MRTHPLQQIYNLERFQSASAPPRVHAEVAALAPIRYLDKKALEKCEVYVYRALHDGSPAMARPCASCLRMIKELGIKKIYYTTHDGYAEEKLIS